MPSFISQLNERNKLLYWFGCYNLAMFLACIVFMQFDNQQILGISRWIKPMKFFLSVWIMSWTMGWILFYLSKKRSVRTISWLITISMFVENFIVTLQSARGTRSHFNVKDPLNGALFSIMGIFILLFTFAAIYALVLFLRQKKFFLPPAYVLGIRLGLFFFIFFSLEAGIMLSKLSHTVGGVDGGLGLPIVNWSTEFGDLRIAHFFGMHALQILPLAGYYVFKKNYALWIFSFIYFSLVMATLITALKGIPLM